MNNTIKVILLSLFIVTTKSFIFTEPAPPSTPQAELLRLEKRFIKAVQEKEWQKVSKLLDKKDAWTFADTIIPNKSLLGLSEVSALECALAENKMDLAKKIIMKVGAYCGSKYKTIATLEKTIAKLKKEQNVSSEEENQYLKKLEDVVRLLHGADMICY